MTFLDYFNGSKFYRLKSKYRREYASAIKKIIDKYKLDIPLQDTYITKPLSGAENALYHTNQWQLKKNLAKEYGFLESKWELVSFPNEYEARIYRVGAQSLSNILAENKARVESKYCMDLIDPLVVASMIAGYFTAKALQAFVITAPAGIAAEIAQWALLISLVSGIIAYIVAVANENELENFEAIIVANDLKLQQWQKSNAYFATRKLSRGKSADTFLGYSNYANGTNFMANSAGSETFYPTQAYNPTQYFHKSYTQAESSAIFSQNSAESSQNQNMQNHTQELRDMDDQTQGRGHYALAGNEGFNEDIASDIPQAEAELMPQNHLAFRQNMLKNDNLRLLQGYADMAEYLGSDDNHSAKLYLQNAYEWNFSKYSKVFYQYVESNMFIENVRMYNKALRANYEHYSIANEKTSRKRQNQSRAEVNKKIADQIKQEAETNDPKANYQGLVFMLFNDELRKQGREESFYNSKGEEWDFNTSAEFKIYEKKLLQSANAENLAKLQGTLELSKKSEGHYGLPSNFEEMITNATNEMVIHEYHKAYTPSYQNRVNGYVLRKGYDTSWSGWGPWKNKKTTLVLIYLTGSRIVPSKGEGISAYFNSFSASIQAGLDEIIATL